MSEYRGFDDRGWICDRCGETIRKAGDGWVQWRKREAELRKAGQQEKPRGPMGQDLELVHHRLASPLPRQGGKYGGKYDGCYFNRADPELAVFDTHLVSFLGPDGLMRLLAMIAEEEVPISEGFEMLKRLHIPGYEHTRLHFEEAIRDGVFELNTDPGYYWQADIRAVDQWLKKKKHF